MRADPAAEDAADEHRQAGAPRHQPDRDEHDRRGGIGDREHQRARREQRARRDVRQQAIDRGRHQPDAAAEIAAVQAEQPLRDDQRAPPDRNAAAQRVGGGLAEGDHQEGEQQQPGNDEIEHMARREREQRAAGKAAEKRDRDQRAQPDAADRAKLMAEGPGACARAGKQRDIRRGIRSVGGKPERNQRG